MGTELKRLPDWQPRLHHWLHDIKSRSFEPGQHDCCIFAAGAVEAQTGVDLAAEFRGAYTTIAGGLILLRRAGFADHVELIAHHLPEAQLVTAREGDLMIVPTEEGPATALVQGTALYILREAGGLGFAPMSAASRLFKVG